MRVGLGPQSPKDVAIHQGDSGAVLQLELEAGALGTSMQWLRLSASDFSTTLLAKEIRVHLHEDSLANPPMATAVVDVETRTFLFRDLELDIPPATKRHVWVVVEAPQPNTPVSSAMAGPSLLLFLGLLFWPRPRPARRKRVLSLLLAGLGLFACARAGFALFEEQGRLYLAQPMDIGLSMPVGQKVEIEGLPALSEPFRVGL
jgi:hypothetical protein